MVEHLQKVYLL